AGSPSRILVAVEASNEAQKHVLAKKLFRYYGEDLTGRCFALWGLAFKPNTDDMREAPSRVLIRQLVERGASLRMHDPIAMEETRRVLALDFADHPDWLARVEYADTPDDALIGADALVIVTEWKTFRSPDFELIKSTLRDPLIVDGRNLYDPATVAGYGLQYVPIGRPIARPSAGPAAWPSIEPPRLASAAAALQVS
ncbi:MAG: hypothetical protein M3O82_08480, partial [Verrucomicrobiota bacterium]|nr:hypothetical protein [Verrucomicrobiota bacterium]